MNIDASRFAAPALCIVDMQNDFVRRGAPLEVADARATLGTHRRLIGRATRAPRQARAGASPFLIEITRISSTVATISTAAIIDNPCASLPVVVLRYPRSCGEK